MTAAQNVRALEPVYLEWGEGRFNTWFDAFAEDYEWGFSPDFPEGPVASDPARSSGRSARLRAWLSPWHAWRCLAERFVPLGEEKVLVLTRYRGVAKGSGLPVDQEGAHLWLMRDGRAVRLEIFPHRRSALAALGMEELPGE